jgi:hypothetical protein
MLRLIGRAKILNRNNPIEKLPGKLQRVAGVRAFAPLPLGGAGGGLAKAKINLVSLRAGFQPARILHLVLQTAKPSPNPSKREGDRTSKDAKKYLKESLCVFLSPHKACFQS